MEQSQLKKLHISEYYFNTFAKNPVNTINTIKSTYGTLSILFFYTRIY